MKVARKPIYAREDTFSATERGDEVKITAYRNVIQIYAKWGFIEVEHEIPLSELAKILVGELAELPK